MGAKKSDRTRLQRQDVIERAMQMADTEGLEALTIRRLAQELGVTPMALYWHFADKDALLAGMSERLWDEVASELDDDPSPRAGGWEELRSITAALIRALRRRPGCATLAPLAVFTSPSGLDVSERALAILAEQGLQEQQVAEAAHFLLSTAISLVATRPGGDLCEDTDDRLRAKRVALASLPPDRYPHVSAMASCLVDVPDVDGYFERGLEFVISGVRGQLSPTA